MLRRNPIEGCANCNNDPLNVEPGKVENEEKENLIPALATKGRDENRNVDKWRNEGQPCRQR